MTTTTETHGSMTLTRRSWGIPWLLNFTRSWTWNCGLCGSHATGLNWTRADCLRASALHNWIMAEEHCGDPS